MPSVPLPTLTKKIHLTKCLWQAFCTKTNGQTTSAAPKSLSIIPQKSIGENLLMLFWHWSRPFFWKGPGPN